MRSEPEDVYPPITVSQLRYLYEHHVVGCHTKIHCHLSSDLPEKKVRFEILGAKETLEQLLPPLSSCGHVLLGQQDL